MLVPTLAGLQTHRALLERETLGADKWAKRVSPRALAREPFPFFSLILKGRLAGGENRMERENSIYITRAAMCFLRIELHPPNLVVLVVVTCRLRQNSMNDITILLKNCSKNKMCLISPGKDV